LEESTEKLIHSYFPEKSPGTRKAYATDLESFSEYLGTDSCREALDHLFSLTHNRANLVVLHYKASIDESGMKAASINRKLSALRSIVKEAKKRELVPWALEINNKKIECTQSGYSLNKSAVRSLMNAARAQKNPRKAARDYAILRCIFDLALKRSCIVKLEMDDLDVMNKVLKVKSTLPPNTRTKLIPKATVSALKGWLEYRGEASGPLFLNLDRAGKGKGITCTSVYRIVQNLGKQKGIQVTPEHIRKAAVCEAVNNAGELGISDHEILAFTDHKQVSSLKQFKKRQAQSQLAISSLISK
jgi:integrase/recombinase XerC